MSIVRLCEGFRVFAPRCAHELLNWARVCWQLVLRGGSNLNRLVDAYFCKLGAFIIFAGEMPDKCWYSGLGGVKTV
jgi:hypothetical protein